MKKQELERITIENECQASKSVAVGTQITKRVELFFLFFWKWYYNLWRSGVANYCAKCEGFIDYVWSADHKNFKLFNNVHFVEKCTAFKYHLIIYFF